MEWKWWGLFFLIVAVAVAVVITATSTTILGWCSCDDKKKKEQEQEEEKEKRSREKQYHCHGSIIPKGSSGWPFIGETLDFIASSYTSHPLSFMEKRTSLYGKVFRTHLLGKRVIVSTDAEVNRVILLNHGNAFVPSYPKSISELFGETSILRMNGALHKRVHASIARFLKSPLLKARITGEIEHSVNLSLAAWSYPNRLVYLQDETKQGAKDHIKHAKKQPFSRPGEDLEFLKREYKEFIKGLICVPVDLPGTQLHKSLKAKERLLRMTKGMVYERKLSMEKSGTGRSTVAYDVIDALLRDSSGDIDTKDNQRLPLDFISGNIIEMMVPGEDSVPMAMTLAVKYLSDNPVALKQLLEESMVLKRRKVESSESYLWTDYMSLPFMQNVISETLRMANIINAVWREATTDVEIKGYLIPKGWCVLASLTAIHMDDQIYDNPYHFDPWRWEREGVGACSNTFSPFGGGQRLCPGLELARLEISIFLHHLVTTYSWVAEKDEVIYFPTVKMKKKLPITVSPLN
ncbi:cytochrome P450, variant 2 [Ancistrocladus abbreviatus]